MKDWLLKTCIVCIAAHKWAEFRENIIGNKIQNSCIPVKQLILAWMPESQMKTITEGVSVM